MANKVSLHLNPKQMKQNFGNIDFIGFLRSLEGENTLEGSEGLLRMAEIFEETVSELCGIEGAQNASIGYAGQVFFVSVKSDASRTNHVEEEMKKIRGNTVNKLKRAENGSSREFYELLASIPLHVEDDQVYFVIADEGMSQGKWKRMKNATNSEIGDNNFTAKICATDSLFKYQFSAERREADLLLRYKTNSEGAPLSYFLPRRQLEEAEMIFSLPLIFLTGEANYLTSSFGSLFPSLTGVLSTLIGFGNDISYFMPKGAQQIDLQNFPGCVSLQFKNRRMVHFLSWLSNTFDKDCKEDETPLGNKFFSTTLGGSPICYAIAGDRLVWSIDANNISHYLDVRSEPFTPSHLLDENNRKCFPIAFFSSRFVNSVENIFEDQLKGHSESIERVKAMGYNVPQSVEVFQVEKKGEEDEYEIFVVLKQFF